MTGWTLTISIPGVDEILLFANQGQGRFTNTLSYSDEIFSEVEFDDPSTPVGDATYTVSILHSEGSYTVAQGKCDAAAVGVNVGQGIEDAKAYIDMPEVDNWPG